MCIPHPSERVCRMVTVMRPRSFVQSAKKIHTDAITLKRIKFCAGSTKKRLLIQTLLIQTEIRANSIQAKLDSDTLFLFLHLILHSDKILLIRCRFFVRQNWCLKIKLVHWNPFSTAILPL